ncbi:MAG: PAC2 family protein [Nanobdellota archaeon]
MIGLEWKITQHMKRVPKLNNPVLIEGLPGIGNVGKIVADYLIDNLKAKKLYSFFSHSFPHSAFINEENLVELPEIALYYVKRQKKKDLLILAGDIQPNDEVSCYSFCEALLAILDEFDTKEIVTIGGIGLADIPEDPQVYATANSHEIIKRYKRHAPIDNNVYGVVGPIVGVTGILVAMAEQQETIALLAETFGHPMTLGIKSSQKILTILKKRFQFKANIKDLDEEALKVEKEILMRKEELMTQQDETQKVDSVSYIG